jgi:Putative quorum-sensing-regulated virulence factor
MPFGKHRGEELSAVPDDYLLWCLENCTSMGPTLRKAIEAHLKIQESETAVASVANILPQWYRKLAMEFHPDRRGGNHEGMKAVNRAKELLLELAEVPQ